MRSFYRKQLRTEAMQELKGPIDRHRDTIEVEQPEREEQQPERGPAVGTADRRSQSRDRLRSATNECRLDLSCQRARRRVDGPGPATISSR
jgi:hypothetical protein